MAFVRVVAFSSILKEPPEKQAEDALEEFRDLAREVATLFFVRGNGLAYINSQHQIVTFRAYNFNSEVCV